MGFVKSERLATGYAQNFINDSHDSRDSDSETRQSATGLRLIDAQQARQYIEQHPSSFAACERASEYLSILQSAGYSASLRTIQRAIKLMKTESAGD